jgi:hypothetical protein
MHSTRIDKPTCLVTFLANLCLLTAGITRTDAAEVTESPFNLYKSTDHGASWVKSGQGLPSNARINALTTAGEGVVAGTDQGVFMSRDAGEHWQPAKKGIGTESRVFCLTAHAGRVFAGTHRHGVLFSVDEGMTWSAVNAGLTDWYVRSLLVVGTRLYAGTDTKGVFVSDNNGTSWRNQRTGLPDSSQVFDLASVDKTVFAGLYSKGLYRWDAERGLWVKTGEVVPLELSVAGNTLVVGHNPGGVFVSDDLGKTWQDGTAGLPVDAPIWTLAADEERVWAGTTGRVGLDQDVFGLFASQDRGKSWTRSDAGLPPSSAAVSFVVAKQFILVGITTRKLEAAPTAR